MSLDNARVVDFLGINVHQKVVTLAILDRLEWDDIPSHLQALKDKIDAYLDFVESGEMLAKHPAADGCMLKIQLHVLHPPPADFDEFASEAREIVEKLGGAFVVEIASNGKTPTGNPT